MIRFFGNSSGRCNSPTIRVPPYQQTVGEYTHPTGRLMKTAVISAVFRVARSFGFVAPYVIAKTRGRKLRSFDPGGVQAISRRSSAATPPDNIGPSTDPGRGRSKRSPCLANALVARIDPLRPLPGSGFLRLGLRGCRCAQPPTNGWNPSGIKRTGRGTSIRGLSKRVCRAQQRLDENHPAIFISPGLG